MERKHSKREFSTGWVIWETVNQGTVRQHGDELQREATMTFRPHPRMEQHRGGGVIRACDPDLSGRSQSPRAGITEEAPELTG